MIFGNICVCIFDSVFCFLWFICFWDGTFPGPNCPGPNLPLFGGGQLGPGQSGPVIFFFIFHDVGLFL